MVETLNSVSRFPASFIGWPELKDSSDSARSRCARGFRRCRSA